MFMRYVRLIINLVTLVILSTLFVTQVDDLPSSRGYLTTPLELGIIAEKSANDQEPYASNVHDMLDKAQKEWTFHLDDREDCPTADDPVWLDEQGGIPVIYAKALAYHLTDDHQYADDVVQIIAEITGTVKAFTLERAQCRLNLSWGIPEIIASADLVDIQLSQHDCVGPLSWEHDNPAFGSGNCKRLFQNWLAKIPYYHVSLSADGSQNNWGASATNTIAYIADYLWDRGDIVLIHRVPLQIDEIGFLEFTPSQAFSHANQIALDRMNGYRVDYRSSLTCDLFDKEQHLPEYPPIKSQITELGIIPEEARREEFCNIRQYNGQYQNYPQLHLGSNIQQCELMLRRGDSRCYDNVSHDDIYEYAFIDSGGNDQVTHLKAERGSIERAINAIIVDSTTEWRHDAALEVALRYYHVYNRLGRIGYWYAEVDRINNCSQDVCFSSVTHGFAADEIPQLPPTVPAP